MNINMKYIMIMNSMIYVSTLYKSRLVYDHSSSFHYNQISFSHVKVNWIIRYCNKFYCNSSTDGSEFELLVSEIRYLYRSCPDLFSFSEKEVENLVKSILSREYRFEPLQVVRYNSNNAGVFRQLRLSSNANATFCLLPNPKDEIVLMSMTRIVTRHYLESSFCSKESLFFREHPHHFYKEVEKLGQVKKVIQLDLSRTFQTISKDRLFDLLDKILHNLYIKDLIHDFCQLEAKDDNGNDMKYFGIPPVGILSEALLNIYLSIFDREFMRAYPDLPYVRYFHEVYIVFPSNKMEEFDPDEEFTTFFMELNLDGNVSILSPGKKDILCYAGKIGINKDGYIILTPKKE